MAGADPAAMQSSLRRRAMLISARSFARFHPPRIPQMRDYDDIPTVMEDYPRRTGGSGI
jgi:hypothetical protein